MLVELGAQVPGDLLAGVLEGRDLGGLLLVVGEFVPPAELLEHVCREFRIAVLNLRPDACHTFGQEVLTVPLDAEARAESQATFGHRF